MASQNKNRQKSLVLTDVAKILSHPRNYTHWGQIRRRGHNQGRSASSSFFNGTNNRRSHGMIILVIPSSNCRAKSLLRADRKTVGSCHNAASQGFFWTPSLAQPLRPRHRRRRHSSKWNTLRTESGSHVNPLPSFRTLYDVSHSAHKLSAVVGA